MTSTDRMAYLAVAQSLDYEVWAREWVECFAEERMQRQATFHYFLEALDYQGYCLKHKVPAIVRYIGGPAATVHGKMALVQSGINDGSVVLDAVQ